MGVASHDFFQTSHTEVKQALYELLLPWSYINFGTLENIILVPSTGPELSLTVFTLFWPEKHALGFQFPFPYLHPLPPRALSLNC